MRIQILIYYKKNHNNFKLNNSYLNIFNDLKNF